MSGLRSRLLILVVLAMVPAFGLLFYTALEQGRLNASDAQETAFRLARLASSDHGRLITETRQVLTALTLAPEVRRRDGPACSALFAQLRSGFPMYANLGAIDPEGRLFCSAVSSPIESDLSDRAYFQLALRSKQFAIGQYQVGRVTKRATINVAEPVLDTNGHVTAVVYAAIDLSWLNRFVTEADLPPGSTITVVDGRGTVLVRAPEGDAWIGRPVPEHPLVQAVLRSGVGVAEASGLDGTVQLVGFSRLAGTPETGQVFVSIGIPKASVFDAVNRTLLRNLLTLVGVGGLTLVAGWVGADFFVLRQVNALISASKRLAAGDLRARTGLGQGRGELAELARAFDEMAASLEEITGRQRMILESVGEGLCGIDMEGRITFVNPAAAALTGYAAEELVGQPMHGLVHHSYPDGRPYPPRACPSGATLRDGAVRDITDEVFWRRDGSRFPVEYVTAPIRSGETILGAVIAFRDVTDRQRMATELARQREALAQSERMADLGRLAAGVAHELKNPLSVVTGRVRLLQAAMAAGRTLSPDDLARHVRSLHEATERMLRITQGLSTYSKPPRPEPTGLDVRELLEATRELVSYVARQANVRVELDVPPEVPRALGDRSQMMQVLLNLATNAIEAMSAMGGGHLTLRAIPDEKGVRIDIADTGPGIPPEHLDAIWEPFYTTKAEGTGLGLSIVRGLVADQPGASLAVHSVLGEGTVFTISMRAPDADPGAGDGLHGR